MNEIEKGLDKIEKRLEELDKLSDKNESAINTLFDRINKIKKHLKISSSEWI